MNSCASFCVQVLEASRQPNGEAEEAQGDRAGVRAQTQEGPARQVPTHQLQLPELTRRSTRYDDFLSEFMLCLKCKEWFSVRRDKNEQCYGLLDLPETITRNHRKTGVKGM